METIVSRFHPLWLAAFILEGSSYHGMKEGGLLLLILANEGYRVQTRGEGDGKFHHYNSYHCFSWMNGVLLLRDRYGCTRTVINEDGKHSPFSKKTDTR
jgi:hypothetical protein